MYHVARGYFNSPLTISPFAFIWLLGGVPAVFSSSFPPIVNRATLSIVSALYAGYLSVYASHTLARFPLSFFSGGSNPPIQKRATHPSAALRSCLAFIFRRYHRRSFVYYLAIILPFCLLRPNAIRTSPLRSFPAILCGFTLSIVPALYAGYLSVYASRTLARFPLSFFSGGFDPPIKNAPLI